MTFKMTKTTASLYVAYLSLLEANTARIAPIISDFIALWAELFLNNTYVLVIIKKNYFNYFR